VEYAAERLHQLGDNLSKNKKEKRKKKKKSKEKLCGKTPPGQRLRCTTKLLNSSANRHSGHPSE